MTRLTLTLPTPDLAAADSGSDDQPRTLTGTAVPYGVKGHTSAGPVTVQRGAIDVPEQLHAVKLVRDHDRGSPVGYLTAADDSDSGLALTFALPRGVPASDQAYMDAQHRLRDGLSVELDNVQIQAGQLTQGTLVACAQVAVPAFTGAAVTQLAAADHDPTAARPGVPGQPHHDPEGDPMPDSPAPKVAPEPLPPLDPDQLPTEQAEQPALVTAAATGRAMTMQRPDPDAQWQAAAQAILQRDPAALSAALADATSTQLGGSLPIQYLGGLWNTDPVARPIIEASTQRPLSSTEVKAWRWNTGLGVDDWAGDKAAIPSTAPTGTLDTITPTFLAGGVDVAREFVDLGSPELLRELMAQAVDDYRRKSEAKHMAAVVAAASSVAGTTDVVEALIGAVGTVNTWGQVSAVFLGATAWVDLVKSGVGFDFLSGTLSLASENGNVGGVRVKVHEGLAAKQVLAMDRRAVVHLELSPPVRVNAVNVANGGIDQALHGYRASYVRWTDCVAEATYV